MRKFTRGPLFCPGRGESGQATSRRPKNLFVRGGQRTAAPRSSCHPAGVRCPSAVGSPPQAPPPSQKPMRAGQRGLG